MPNLVGEDRPSERAVTAQVKKESLIQQRRQQLVAAAVAVIGRKGYHNTTVRDLVEEAGLTAGTIYNYVRTKDDILFLVCEHLVSTYHRAVLKAMEGSEDPLARLRAAIRAPIEAMEEHQDGILLLYNESHALNRDSIRAILRQVAAFIRLMETILTEARDAGYIEFEHGALAANIVTFLPAMIALRRWDLRRSVPREDMIEGLAEFLMRGLGLKLVPPPQPPATDGHRGRRRKS
jgi:AcrR family transcriptional regulator